MNIAFAGFRHYHIFTLYDMAAAHGGFTVTGGFEEDGEARRQAAQTREVNFKYPSYEALLSDDSVEAVALGDCYGNRGGQAVLALRAGKHVIADKPLCTSLAELDEIEKIAAAKGLSVSCMFTMRFEPLIAPVRDFIKSGALGKINNIYFGGQHPLMYGTRPRWYYDHKLHGGTLNDIAIHGIDAVNDLCGLRVREINAARCWNGYAEKEPQFGDCGQMMLTLDGGAGLIADVSYAIPNGIAYGFPHYWQFYIWGAEGVLIFSPHGQTAVCYLGGDKVPRVIGQKPTERDFLTDFLSVTRGESGVVLPMRDVLDATRDTLTVQQFADNTI
ncbi:MAG: Gfo/Idh/MocA family oxidoreductase [Clostridiales bacterium]|jgi:predicted dehydrogenase|nr:Gfo/Idh/MocA family oxidoreductase [Clostridiales bacterium]